MHSDPSIFDMIVHPYDTDAFNRLLRLHDLYKLYPNLISNLRHGFPLGDNFPVLNSSNIIPNHPSFFDHIPHIDAYISEEIFNGRMSGPFSQERVERILRGPFQSSPLIVAVQPQAPGEPDKIRICRHLSKATKLIHSVNSFISKDDFPTRFDTASRVADIVSFSFIWYGLIVIPGFLPHRGSSLIHHLCV